MEMKREKCFRLFPLKNTTNNDPLKNFSSCVLVVCPREFGVVGRFMFVSSLDKYSTSEQVSGWRWEVELGPRRLLGLILETERLWDERVVDVDLRPFDNLHVFGDHRGHRLGDRWGGDVF